MRLKISDAGWSRGIAPTDAWLFQQVGQAGTRAVLGSPAGRLKQLFDGLHDLPDPTEVVKLSAEHDAEFLPPSAND